MGIVERIESANRGGDMLRNRSPSEVSVSNERSNGHACGAESEQGSSTLRMMMLNFNVPR